MKSSTPKYGMKHRTIVYWQRVANDHRLYTGGTYGVKALLGISSLTGSRFIAHMAIAMAAVSEPNKVRMILKGGR